MGVEIKSREQLREENLAKISKFILMDDTYMTAFFNEQIELTQFVLRIIMKMDGLVVKSARTQKPFKNIQGRSITLDVTAVDENGTQYDIEVQQESAGANPKRARYHSSMLDSNALLPGDDFDTLPETYVIFVTSKDYWKQGLPIYTVDRYIKEMEMTPFEDKAHIIYVNGEHADDTPLGKLMHDFKCAKPNEMCYPNLAERAHFLKDTEGGYDNMCKLMEDSNREARKQEAYQIAMKLIRKGIVAFEDIADVTNLTLDDVKELAEIVKAGA